LERTSKVPTGPSLLSNNLQSKQHQTDRGSRNSERKGQAEGRIKETAEEERNQERRREESGQAKRAPPPGQVSPGTGKLRPATQKGKAADVSGAPPET